MLKGAVKDEGHISPDWEVRRDLIDGVKVKDMRNIVTGNGVMTELFRSDWKIASGAIEHVIQVTFRAHAVSAWHCHTRQTDHVTAIRGVLRLALYDGRESSPTYRKVNEFNLGAAQPMLVVIPPGVWHGLRNLENGDSTYVSMFDRAYDYADPDEWRLPPDTPEIPCRI